MESKELFLIFVFIFTLIADLKVQAMSTVNTDFERYLRAMNSSTTVPNVEERIVWNDSYVLAILNHTYTDHDGKLVSSSVENARYGEGQILNVTGILVHVTSRKNFKDDRACNADILGTLGTPFPTEPWIALVQRGSCNFEDKVNHVALKGAVGVIIYNDKQVVNLEKMQIKDKNRNITAVMTFRDTGRHLAAILDDGLEVISSITRGRSGIRPINTLNKNSVLFVSISFIVLMIISLVWLIFYYVQRFRYLQSKDQQSRQLCSVTKRAVMKIPTKTGKDNDKDMENDCCAICIEAYKPSDCIRILPCKHEFHKNCIDPWLIEHRTCPMCKLDVLKHYGYVVGEPSTTSSPTNERIINANDHVIVTPSNANSSGFENISSNSSSNNSGSYQVNVIVIGRTIPAALDTIPNSDTSISNSIDGNGGASTTSTASRQVTDV